MAKKEQDPKLTTEEILQGLAAVFSPAKKQKKDKCNRIIVINGKIADNMISLKQAKKIAKQLATTDADIKVYVLEGTLSVDLDVKVA